MKNRINSTPDHRTSEVITSSLVKRYNVTPRTPVHYPNLSPKIQFDNEAKLDDESVPLHYYSKPYKKVRPNKNELYNLFGNELGGVITDVSAMWSLSIQSIKYFVIILSSMVLLRFYLLDNIQETNNDFNSPRAVHLLEQNGSMVVRRIDLYRNKITEQLENEIDANKFVKRRIIIKSVEDGQYVENTCKPLNSWQESAFPTCNIIHEISLLSVSHNEHHPNYNINAKLIAPYPFNLVNHGFKRDVWSVATVVRTDETSETTSDNNFDIQMFALKTLRYENDFDSRGNMRGQRLDAAVSERLTKSKHIVNIYGYCGFSGLFDYTSQGNLGDHLLNMTQEEKLRVAVDISAAIADLHNIDVEGKATVVHADIAARQFIKIGNSFLLNDFNTASALYYKSMTDEQCPYGMLYAKDKNRAPEEFMNPDDSNYVNEKIDVYSLGNIFYAMVAGERRFQGMHLKDAIPYILNGTIPDPLQTRMNRVRKMKNEKQYRSHHSSDEKEYDVTRIDEILTHAMKMCIVLKPEERSSAREVSKFLKESQASLYSSITKTMNDSSAP